METVLDLQIMTKPDEDRRYDASASGMPLIDCLLHNASGFDAMTNRTSRSLKLQAIIEAALNISGSISEVGKSNTNDGNRPTNA